MKPTDNEKHKSINLVVAGEEVPEARTFRIIEGGILCVTMQDSDGKTWLEFYPPSADWFIDTRVSQEE